MDLTCLAATSPAVWRIIRKGPSEPGNRPKWPMPRTRLRPTVHGDNSSARVARGCESRSSGRKRSERLTTINVTVAAYRMFAEARADWDAFELSAESSSSQLVDAALIERRGGQVSEFHCLSASGWGRGIIASAICCVLWPPAMVVGALAGSVGRHTMTEIRRGLSREAIGGLGAVMEMGAFVSVTIADRNCTPEASRGPRALHLASLPLNAPASALRAPLDLDESED